MQEGRQEYGPGYRPPTSGARVPGQGMRGGKGASPFVLRSLPEVQVRRFGVIPKARAMVADGRLVVTKGMERE